MRDYLSRPQAARIEPSIMTLPQMLGSPGEPGIYSMGAMPGEIAPVRFAGASALPLIALLAGGGALLASSPLNEPASSRVASGKIRPPEDLMPDEMPFKRAFAAARRKGLDRFTWRGKRYTTELA